MAELEIMGRGLSELQKYILITAVTKEPSDEYHARGRLYNADIFSGFYEWQSGYYDCNGTFVPRPIQVASKNFHPGKLIDQKKYNTVQSVVRKACDRLAKRGLVVGLVGRAWAGIEITDKGREVAASLIAKSTAQAQPN